MARTCYLARRATEFYLHGQKSFRWKSREKSRFAARGICAAYFRCAQRALFLSPIHTFQTSVLEILLSSPDDLPTIMPRLFEGLNGRRKIALYGDMGAGKTTLAKAFCQHLGVRQNTASPTFSLVNQYSYAAADGSEALLHHLDLYRLRSLAEALDIGLEDLLYDPWYCVVEWPQIAEPLFPPDVAKIRIEITGENTRRISIA
jgi:tRNA threonylcarbamoyladenosine biosynthesis protein TsaE